MEYDLTAFRDGCRELNIDLTEEQYRQFLIYYELLIEKNKVMNLTAITDFKEVVEKHFIDSLSLIKVVDLKKKASVLDLGTGAGFPGIPLKIAFPDLKLLLVDSLNKRILFLREVIEELQLKNIDAVHGRAEELAVTKEYRESFDFCVSRAVANLSSLSEYCIPFVKQGGYFIPYKSGNMEEELHQSKRAIHVLGAEIEKTVKFQLPNTEINRSFFMIKKVKPTPKAYPRKAGMPSKNPII